MKSWPTLEVPPVPFEFPELKLLSTWGKGIERKIFTSYVCGITPYDATHLGHAATYLTFDLIHRYQILRGYKLNFVENITDVDDPLLERANRDNIDWKKLADQQVELFQRDMTALHIIPPRLYLSVSETINLVISGMKELEKQDLLYELQGDYYFKVSKHLESLPLALNKAITLFRERGGDPDRSGKEHPLDPLLWRRNIPGEPGWESPYGFGRPGWHIECSVIAISGVDVTSNPILNLQGGGSDLIFPHHFMSRIIAEGIAKRDFAAQYVHTGMIGLDGEKMSKSRGNLVFVHKLIDEGIDPMVIRFALLKSHYSKDRMWSAQLLDESESDVNLIRSALSKMEVAETESFIKKMVMALSDNLDTPKVVNLLIDWSKESLNGATGGSAGTMSRFLDSAMGLAL